MLYYAEGPRGEGSFLNLANAPDGLAPPAAEYHTMLAAEYVGYLRAAYRANPRPFLLLARDALVRDFTIVSKDRYDLAEALYKALVGVAAARGWNIAGGKR